MATTAAAATAAESTEMVIKQPLDLVRLALGEVIRVKMRGGRELRGRLHVCPSLFFLFNQSSSLQLTHPSQQQGYDAHLNMVLGDVEETAEITETDEATDEEVVRVVTRTIPMLFVRGDGVILIAPPLRTGSL